MKNTTFLLFFLSFIGILNVSSCFMKEILKKKKRRKLTETVMRSDVYIFISILENYYITLYNIVL